MGEEKHATSSILIQNILQLLFLFLEVKGSCCKLKQSLELSFREHPICVIDKQKDI